MAVKAVKKYGKGGRMYEKGGKLSFLDKIKGKKDKTVAQGADRDDVRADRKAARQERKKERKEARAEKTKARTIGNRTVIKQKNKSEEGVRSTRKTVYSGNQASRLVTKEKQRTNRKGKKAGMLNFKDKTVERKDFSVRKKSKGTTPNAGS